MQPENPVTLLPSNGKPLFQNAGRRLRHISENVGKSGLLINVAKFCGNDERRSKCGVILRTVKVADGRNVDFDATAV